MLNYASLYDSYSSGADRDRMKEVAERIKKAVQDEGGEIRTTSRIIKTSVKNCRRHKTRYKACRYVLPSWKAL